MEPTIVGREKEIEYFTNVLKYCKEGKGGTYIITGPVGVGKTTLMEAISKIAKSENFVVLFGRGLDETSAPYLPFTEALKNFSTEKKEEGYVPIGLSLSTEESIRMESVELAREKGRVLEIMSKRILEFEKKAPLLIIIDDLQWADAASLSLFVYLARNIAGKRVLLLAAFPEEAMKQEKNLAFVNTIIQLRSEKISTVLELKPLTYEAILKMLELEFGICPEEIAKVIYEKTEGIPLFVSEFVRAIVEENMYDANKRELRVTPEELRIPQSVQALIKGRLSMLSENARKVLTNASIYGRVFEYDVLEKVMEMDTESILDAIDELLEKGFIREESGEKYRFAHNAIYETVLGGAIGVRKRVIHRKIAEVLEQIRSTEEYVPEIARHYFEAQMFDKASAFAKRSAEAFARIYAVDETIKYGKMAQECLEKTGKKEELIDVKILLGDMLLLSGKYEEAMVMYEDARKIAESVKEMEKLGVAIGRAGLCYHRMGSMNKALEHLTTALEIFEKCGAKKEYARVLRQIGWVYERKGDFEHSLHYVSRSLEITKELGDDAELADAYHRMGTTQLSIGLMEEAEKNLTLAIEIRKKNNIMKGLADSYNNLGILYHDTGEIEKAVEYYLKAKEIYAKIGDIAGESIMSNNLGIIYHDRGEWEKALEHYMRDYHTSANIGNLWGHMISASNLGSLYKEMEKYEEALQYYKEALEYSQKIGEKWIYCSALGSVAEIYAIKGDIEKALEIAENCVLVGRSTGSKDSLASALYTKGVVERYAKHWEDAEESLTNAKLLYMEMKMKSGIASADEELGILYAEKGEKEKAKKFFEDAMRVYTEIGQTKSVEKIKKEMIKYFG
ncbi:MAG: BREX system ATP-binding domain-containing protein [Thermoplasmata archaeon]